MPSSFCDRFRSVTVSYEWNAQCSEVSTSPHHRSEHGWKEYLHQAGTALQNMWHLDINLVYIITSLKITSLVYITCLLLFGVCHLALWRSIALIALLNQMGSFVPCRAAQPSIWVKGQKLSILPRSDWNLWRNAEQTSQIRNHITFRILKMQSDLRSKCCSSMLRLNHVGKPRGRRKLAKGTKEVFKILSKCKISCTRCRVGASDMQLRGKADFGCRCVSSVSKIDCIQISYI